MRRILAAVLFIAMVASIAIPSASARPSQQDATVLVVMSSHTLSYDLGPNNNTAPDGWSSVNFDDSAWVPTVKASPDVVACVVAHTGSWSGFPPYWGAVGGNFYLFRNKVTLANAHGGYAATLQVRSFGNADDIWVNGSHVDFYKDSRSQSTTNYDVSNLLTSGNNVIALFAEGSHHTYSSSDHLCSALSFRLNVHEIGVSGSAQPPRPVSRGITPLSPTAGMAVPANSQVLFVWKPVAGATNYSIRLWLVTQAGDSQLTPDIVTTKAATIFAKTSWSWNDQHALPGTYQYQLLARDLHGNILAGWSTPVDFKIISS